MDNSYFFNNSNEDFGNLSRPKSPLKGVMFIFVGIVVFFLLFYFLLIRAPGSFPEGIIFNIEKGSNLIDISQNLKENKVIRSKVLFEMFVVIYGGENHIADGDYLFQEKIPVYEVAKRIVKQERHLAPLKITIPEGFSNAEMAETFSIYLKNFNKEKFLENAKEKEGYLFPDTYFFFTTDNEENVIKSLSDNFSRKIKKVSNDITSSGKNEKDIVIMASIIEKEAKGDNDRGLISGILWSRLSKKMPLQVDAAPITYKEKGLPDMPICNPGLKAIQAAINPVKSSYLYYLHDKNGQIHYAVSFLEHKKNKALYLK